MTCIFQRTIILKCLQAISISAVSPGVEVSFHGVVRWLGWLHPEKVKAKYMDSLVGDGIRGPPLFLHGPRFKIPLPCSTFQRGAFECTHNW